MNKAYLAAPIFNPGQLRVVKTIHMTLKLLEFEVFSPYHASQSIWKGRAPKDCSQEERDQVLRGNIENLHWANLLLCWVGGTEDGRTDTGVVWEMGYFNALKAIDSRYHATKLFTLAYIDPTDNRQHMNLMLAGTVDAVCYGPAQLHRALESLVRGGVDVVKETFHPDKHLLHEKEPIV
jgi:nucleoside 2-deoxyribosyltransferase